MSSFSSGFKETDTLFLEFSNEFNNPEGLSSVGDNSNVISLNSWSLRGTSIRMVRIPMTIAPGAEKPISPYAVRLSQVVKGALQLFCASFNNQTMNRFVDHQMLTSFNEFRGDCHRHFKKYSNPEQACANLQHMNRAFQKQSTTNKTTRQKQPYNHSSEFKSFLQ
ncbi:CACTA en-spm transposon protein [Cucumis melo var. makuwa]|uniref:CACTA en-spm transposon protein n=1 Tax=Cucumis melo var. makuwa TaxID=1194695 RepID=A0A5D3C2S9_CUCMM|nr:CACTA en-spm transposon protein [Cucumis melo var. makuwa]